MGKPAGFAGRIVAWVWALEVASGVIRYCDTEPERVTAPSRRNAPSPGPLLVSRVAWDCRAVTAAIEYVHANDMATVNSKTFIKLAESPRQTVEKGLRKDHSKLNIQEICININCFILF